VSGSRHRARVGVDVTMWDNPRGFGRFTRHAVAALLDLDHDTDYILYGDSHTVASGRLPRGAAGRAVSLRQRPADVLSSGGTRHPLDILRLSTAAVRDGLDAFLFPAVLSYFPTPGVPSIVGIHDSTDIEYPHLVFGSRRAAWTAAMKARWAISTAAALFTVSESAKRTICAHLGIGEARLSVVPEAPAPVFHPRAPDERARVLARIGLPSGRPFFLYAGGINPHKNVEALLEAYAAVRQARSEAPDLVVAGALEGSYVSAAASLLERIERLALGPHVRLPGFVPDDVLACLYGQATAVVIPSLAEGFSLPPVEAAACGAPLVVSDLPVHREMLGDAALYFPPKDRTALVTALLTVVDSPEMTRELGRQAARAVSPLSWSAAGERLHHIVRQVVSRRAGRGGRGSRAGTGEAKTSCASGH
jgi:glycosyltransferase involved in cell wall biosynthesis